MLSILQRLPTKNWRPGRAAAAGLIATAAYSVAMEADKYITGNYFNDVTFIQGLLAWEKRPGKTHPGLDPPLSQWRAAGRSLRGCRQIPAAWSELAQGRDLRRGFHTRRLAAHAACRSLPSPGEKRPTPSPGKLAPVLAKHAPPLCLWDHPWPALSRRKLTTYIRASSRMPCTHG